MVVEGEGGRQAQEMFAVRGSGNHFCPRGGRPRPTDHIFGLVPTSGMLTIARDGA
jgi:hypothetical protein